MHTCIKIIFFLTRPVCGNQKGWCGPGMKILSKGYKTKMMSSKYVRPDSLHVHLEKSWCLCATVTCIHVHVHFRMSVLTNWYCLAMNFVSPTSIISVALLCQLQVNFERITEWLAIIQSLQTLQQKKIGIAFYTRELYLINISNMKTCIWPSDHMCILSRASNTWDIFN